MLVIPAIDLSRGRVVRLVGGDPERSTVFGADPIATARTFAAAGAGLIHVVDLDAALGRGDNGEVISRLCAAVAAPVQVGGGLRTAAAVAARLAAGAARVVLGTRAVREPAFAAACVAAHGDRIVVALDVRSGLVAVDGWRETAGALAEVLPVLEAAGAPRFLVTAVAADGSLRGPDCGLYRWLATAASRPVLASGGVGGESDLVRLAGCGVEGAVVGTALYRARIDLGAAIRRFAEAG
ncbi:MAG TPA: 1-(5-phosphoribosyl)-5-[(5-phosphoribosylamino)methylideneamino] imidazole-4-carboxamide isomerase [Candidatus Micrarchaeia archaeon]|nr:1-(5-phosphoribosyl)-5-[(5-phosphoribosylamino)methylideneamino] imidazole-4-carboxamide isomerase [Candidatus Micrarchaeia archaeon]